MASSKKIVTMICLTLISLAAIGCSSDSNPVATNPGDRGTPLDTAPPAVPTDLALYFDGDSGSAIISWAANAVDSDLAGYVVERDYYGTIETLTDPLISTSYFVDETPLPGTSIYNVFAVDLSGNESAETSVELVVVGTPHRIPRDLQQ